MSSTARTQSVFRACDEWLSVLRYWIVTRGPWWATSIVAHAVVLSFGLLLVGTAMPLSSDAPPQFEVIDTENPAELDSSVVSAEIEPPSRIDLAATSATPDLVSESLAESFGPAEPPGDPPGSPDLTVGTGERGPFGIGAPLPSFADGPASPGKTLAPSRPGGEGGFPGRGKLHAGTGRIKAGDQAVARALKWIARHQNADGSWSLQDYAHQCNDATCTGAGNADADAAATALGLLPFLAAGQTHRQKGPYAKHIYLGLQWLTSHQKNNGDLSVGSSHRMYSHGLATIAMAEAAGMTRDHQLRASAQQAVKFIEAAQYKSTGGWRYQPGDPGDTSVVGWQVMALKSAQMAGLAVDSVVLERAGQWLETAATAEAGRFAYQPGGAVSPTISAVGLLAMQYLGAQRDEPRQQGGRAYLLANLPAAGAHNAYYWYYATQVMHNLQGAEWDTWNRKMRAVLIQSQAKEGCANGSWDPLLPTKDAWAEPGGRLMVTSLNCLTLEVYYRYLPLYRTADVGARN